MYLIRQAITEDTGTIIQIAETTFWHTYSQILEKEQISYMLSEIYSYQNISAQIEKNTQTYLLVVEDNKAVAFAAFSPRKEDTEISKLHKLYCLPETQGKGYGRILINEIIAETRAAKIHTLDLNVNRYNKAKVFYEKMGFEVAYEEDIPVGRFWMNDYVMRKDLR